jgi:hypothetical protein
MASIALIQVLGAVASGELKSSSSAMTDGGVPEGGHAGRLLRAIGDGHARRMHTVGLGPLGLPIPVG